MTRTGIWKLQMIYFSFQLSSWHIQVPPPSSMFNTQWRSSRVWMRSIAGGWHLHLAELWMRSNLVWMQYSREWMRSSREGMISIRMGMRSSREWMRSSREGMISSLVWMQSSRGWMRSSRVSGWDLAECGLDLAGREWDLAECGWDLAVCGWDLAEWLERLTANAKVVTVLGSIPASSEHTGIWVAANEAQLNKVHKKKIPPVYVRYTVPCVYMGFE